MKRLFERLAETGLASAVRPFYEKHREFILFLLLNYLFFFISVGLFWLFSYPLKMDPLFANALSWTIRLVLGYLINRVWVFREDKAQGSKGILREFGSYILARLGVLAIDELILFLGINCLGLNKMLVKITGMVIVFFVSYIFSRYIVFRKNKVEDNPVDNITEE